ncbi:hypothetical protein SDC9_203049 [bioreactor metagenome]|uniref:Uncharacterized protein n=1 Tax=bioreactor metagenome TaxID=1076179 RepID=A0A645IW55_9ZZZZ
MALMSLDYDTKHINFMVERGMKIKDKVITVSEEEIKRLNEAYGKMYRELTG